ncbi:unnamed protein product, partial [Meganyctiphanes norvegica]|uniref:RING-type domain-containing protein n=1 Tax=Meganyctiphanes norvegica TaxID=48144 RepID=A0AAV2QYU5_MEGNR
MDIINCKICFHSYDELEHRPRTLGCGHYFCEQCIDIVISSGIPKCPVCQQTITIKTASEATVNFALEELVQNVKTLDVNSNSAKEETPMPILGLCSKHSTCRLNFVCMTHNMRVCRDCTVIDHKLDKCHVISFQEEIEIKRKNTLSNIDLLLKSLIYTKGSLESHIESKGSEIVLLESKLEEIQKQVIQYQHTIENMKKSELSAQNILSKIKIKQKELQKSKSNLQEITSLPELMTSIDDPIKNINEVHIWEDDIRNEYNLISTVYILTLIKKFPIGVYATENAGGFNRSARILEINGKVHLLALQKQIPPRDAYSLPMPLLDTMYSNPEVFISLSYNGSYLGTVIFRLANSEHGRYFRNICCGTYGPSYKGVQLTLVTPDRSSNPDRVHNNIFDKTANGVFAQTLIDDLKCIGCSHHINEDGTVNNDILVTNEERECMMPGNVYAFGNGGFIIPQAVSTLQMIPIGEIIHGTMEVVQFARSKLSQRHSHQSQNNIEIIHGTMEVVQAARSKLSQRHSHQSQNNLVINEVGMVLSNQE